MSYETDPDPFWLRWYKKAIWSRKTPAIVLVCFYVYVFVSALLVKWRVECLDYLYFTNFIFTIPLVVATVSLGLRAFLYRRGWPLASLKIAVFWLLVIGGIAFNAFVVLGKGQPETGNGAQAQEIPAAQYHSRHYLFGDPSAVR